MILLTLLEVHSFGPSYESYAGVSREEAVFGFVPVVGSSGWPAG